MDYFIFLTLCKQYEIMERFSVIFFTRKGSKSNILFVEYINIVKP